MALYLLYLILALTSFGMVCLLARRAKPKGPIFSRPAQSHRDWLETERFRLHD